MRENTKLAKLRRGLHKARIDFDEAVEKIKTGELQFHDTDDACAITHIGVSGAYRTLYILVMAGDLGGLYALGKRLEDFGRSQKCQIIETDGRPGFEHLFRLVGKGEGYHQVSHKYRKAL